MVVSDKERAELLRKIMSTPVGGGRRFVVMCGNDPCAGFDDGNSAHAYIAMMRKGSEKQKAPACAKMSWSVQER